MGYNIYKGDPLSNSGDPGFSTTPIFQLKYSQEKKTADKRFKIPDNTSILPQESCKLDFTSEEINGETSLTKSFEQDVSVEGGFGGASFKASVSFKTKSQEINTKKYIYVNAKATCSMYKAAF